VAITCLFSLFERRSSPFSEPYLPSKAMTSPNDPETLVESKRLVGGDDGNAFGESLSNNLTVDHAAYDREDFE
jgi:hypothetical protein